MLWIVFISLLLAAVTWLLFAPIRFTIKLDNRHAEVGLTWQGIMSVRVLPVDSHWYMKFQVFFIRWKYPLLKLIKEPQAREKSDPKQSKRPGRYSPKRMRKLLGRLWQTFHLRSFLLNIDTDDYVLNAKLFPLFQGLQLIKHTAWQINFSGKVQMQLVIENKLYRMLYAFRP